jgi:SAM-dependent methyltransferase
LEQFGGTKAFHRNVTPDELATLIAEWLSVSFGRAEITTAAASIQAFAKPGGELKVLRKAAGAPAAPPAAHNRTKHYLLPEGEAIPFLVDLGIMAKDGSVIKSMYPKFRQINRFLEFIADVLPELRQAALPAGGAAATAGERELTVVDFGCGKAYLTFAAYHYLAVQQKLPIRMVGLDLKADLMAQCAALATSYGYDGLSFQAGDIAAYQGAAADMVISLHACDTASDLVLAQAVRWNSRVILAAPCCQHELNAQLAAKTPAAPGRLALQAAFRHGIVRERLAALLTDVLRAEMLESKGWQVQILEFIDLEHTAKNLLIRAVRRDPASAVSDAGYRELRDFLGVSPSLEALLK